MQVYYVPDTNLGTENRAIKKKSLLIEGAA